MWHRCRRCEFTTLLHNRLHRHCRIVKHIEQRALTLHRLTLCRPRLHACHIGKLRLLRLVRHRGILHRSHILYIIQKSTEIELGKERLEHIYLRAADGKVGLIKLNRHIKTYRGQDLRLSQLLRRGGYICSRLTTNGIGIGDDILHIAPLLNKLARPLLANARNTRNIIRRITPQSQDITNKCRIVNAILLLDSRTVDNLYLVTLLLINLTILAH